MVHKKEVCDYTFQATPESLRKTHTFVLKYTECPDGMFDVERETSFELKFNKKSSPSTINTIDDVDSITISKTYNSSGVDSYWFSQYSWSCRLEKLVKKLNDLQIVLKYEQENRNPSSDQRIEEINEKIAYHQVEIEKIKNDSFTYTYQNTVEVKSITLQRSKLARMDFYTSTGRGSYGDQIDFYWNVNELINHNIFNVVHVVDMG